MPDPWPSPSPSPSPWPSPSPSPSPGPSVIDCPGPCPTDACQYSCQCPPPTTTCDTCEEAPISNACPALMTTGTGSVAVKTGQFQWQLGLLSTGGIGGLGWSFGLDYLSDNGIDGLLGKGWDYPQNVCLQQMGGGSGDVQLLSGNQTAEPFFLQADGTYSSASNNTRAVLTRSGSGADDEFVLSSAGGVITRFFGFDAGLDTPGKVKSVTDRYGNSRSYSWTNTDGVVQLTSLTDSYGRTVTYRYYDWSSSGSSSPAGASWLTGWLYRKRITVDHTQVGSSLTDFPVLLSLDADANIGLSARSDGHDIRITTSDGTTLLEYERATWSVVGGKATAQIWFRAPSLSSVADTDFYIYYGNPSASDGEDAANVWDDDSVAVWHLEAADPTADSTGDHDLTDDGTDDVAGQIGRGRDFVAADTDYMTAADSPDWDFPDAFTLQCWTNLDSSSVTRDVVHREGAVDHDGFFLEQRSTNKLWFGPFINGSYDYAESDSAVHGAWHLIHGVRAADGTLTMYVDGVAQTKTGMKPGAIDSDSVVFLGRHSTMGTRYLNGILDEVRLSKTARSAAWIAAEYTNQATPTTFYTLGEAETEPGGYAGKLREIEDFLGRKLNFQYDAYGHLTAVVTPSILKAAEGNTFPGGTAYVFRYDTDNADPNRRDDLIRIYYPNDATPYIDEDTRTVDVDSVYTYAKPRYLVEYGQDPSDSETYGKVIDETVGDPAANVGGDTTCVFETGLYEESIFYDSEDPRPQDIIVSRTTATDPNGNQTVTSFNAQGMPVKTEVLANRRKLSLHADSYVTWTRYNPENQPIITIFPEGNTIEYEYDDGLMEPAPEPSPSPGPEPSPSPSPSPGPEQHLYIKRRGLLKCETHRPDNDYGLPHRPGSNGQTRLTRCYFYEPLFNQQCAVIERRGNPINESGDYFPPQNDPDYDPQPSTDTDRSRYATISYFDYQQNTLETIQKLSSTLDVTPEMIEALIDHVDQQMKDGGLPEGFRVNLGDLNGDGTGNGTDTERHAGAATRTVASDMSGNTVKVRHPSVRHLVPATMPTPSPSPSPSPEPSPSPSGGEWRWEWQERMELFTYNARGQQTTHTDPEGNLTVTVRYPESDPEGDGRFVAAHLTNKQYGYVREVHVDADPNDVMSLIGADGDLVDFIPGIIERTNTPGVYQDLITRYEGGDAASGGGCGSCAYDALGNPLAVTDPRGFTSRTDRNELGEAYRTIAPAPYEFKVETHFDAERRTIRVDTEDQVVQYLSDDPTAPNYAKFIPTGNLSAGVAHVPMKPGPGGTVRPGWFTNLYEYDALGRKIEEDIDATGSYPDSLVTRYEYDANGNLIKTTKPEGNTVRYDYDERDLRIAELIAGEILPGPCPSPSPSPSPEPSPSPSPEPELCGELVGGALTISSYDRNGNPVNTISPADRDPLDDCSLSATIRDAFGTGMTIRHTGDWLSETEFDGFDRAVKATDAVGNVAESTYDPDARVIESTQKGPAGGPSPTDRTGTDLTLARSESRYDEAGQEYESQQDVFLNTGGTDAAPVHTLDSGRTVTHAGGGLAANSEYNDHLSDAVLTAGQSSYVLSRTVFDRSGRAVVSAADNEAVTTFTLDGAGRQLAVADPLGNMTENTLDGNGNVIRTKQTEYCTISTATDAEVFESVVGYDCLNRSVVQAAQGADATISDTMEECCTWAITSETLFALNGYDGRGNRTVTIDPKGNTSVTEYDAAGRMIQTIQHLRVDGDGANGPAANQTFLPSDGAAIRMQMVYDSNDRLSQLTDDRGGVTRYTYDEFDRQVEMQFHDSSTRSTTYNAASDVTACVDENGSEFAYTHDAIGRLASVTITRAANVEGTTAEAFEYDGLSRQTFARDSIDTTDVDATFAFDSLGRAVEEGQAYGGNTRYVTQNAFVSASATRFTYADTREVGYNYDDLYRRTKIENDPDGSPTDIAEWSFFGPSRLAELTLGNQTPGNQLICTYMNNARTHSAVQSPTPQNPAWGNQSSDRLGYDGTGRMITKRYLDTAVSAGGYDDTETFVGFTTQYDRASNKDYERHLHAESRSSLYPSRDSLNRLREYQRGQLSEDAQGNVAVSSPITLPGTDTQRTYDLDTLGNWKNTVYTPVGGSETTEVRQHNYVNQTTTFADTAVAYDHGDNTGDAAAQGKGNIADDGTRLYAWDAFSRLVQVTRKSDSLVVATYTYDALGRRIRKVVTNGGIPGDSSLNGTTDFIYQGVQCVEERDSGNNAVRQYVWGQYVDELIQQRDVVADEYYYLLSDLLYRSVALTDNSKEIVEAYDTDAYGNTLIVGPGSPPRTTWFTDDDANYLLTNPLCQFIFTGRRYDPETQIYFYRARYFAPPLGRFLSRDPRGYLDVLNLYEYVVAIPTEFLDPSGTALFVEEATFARRSFVANVTVGLYDYLCPCFDVGTEPHRARRGRQPAVLRIVLTRKFVKDGKREKMGDCCECVKKHPAGCKLLHRAVTRDGEVTIRYLSEADRVRLRDRETDDWARNAVMRNPGVYQSTDVANPAAGGTLWFDPARQENFNRRRNPTPADATPSAIVLGHELGHADPLVGTGRASEPTAIRLGNMLRLEAGIERLRTTRGGRPLPRHVPIPGFQLDPGGYGPPRVKGEALRMCEDAPHGRADAPG